MPFPTGDAYMAAVQHPRTAFTDLDLRRSAVETTPLGLPKPYSGGFATTFRFNSANGSAERQWAVRCFKQDIPDLPRRYAAISRLWKQNGETLFVRAEYIERGIRVGEGWYPIVKMDWVQGDLLDRYLEARVQDALLHHTGNRRRQYRDGIFALTEQMRMLARRLETLGVAHGDLQHGNIIVQQGRPRLIDYDGVFLPELRDIRASEMGHINYQHPQRDHRHYDARLDRFSNIVIHLALQGLAREPELWRQFDNGDNLLFRQSDFLDPDHSPLLHHLAAFDDLARLAERFRFVCKGGIADIPTLDAFLEHAVIPPRPAAVLSSAVARPQYPVVDAASLGALSEYVGARIEVTGLITRYDFSRTTQGARYLLLYFGDHPKRALTLVLWPKVLAEMEQQAMDPLSCVGKQVRVTGVVNVFEGWPQMEIESASQIRTIVSDAQTVGIARGGGAAVRPNGGDARAAAVFDKLYGSASPPAAPRQTTRPVTNVPPRPSPAPNQPINRSTNQPINQSPITPQTPRPSPAPAPTSVRSRPAAAGPVAAPPTATISRPAKPNEANPNCFVATATFGRPDAFEVQTLRWYRDHILARSRMGRLATNVYYQIGPLLAGFVRRSPALKQFSAALLGRVAHGVQRRWLV